jgi:hypothetical protein
MKNREKVMGQIFDDMGQIAVKISERWEPALARDFNTAAAQHT